MSDQDPSIPYLYVPDDEGDAETSGEPQLAEAGGQPEAVRLGHFMENLGSMLGLGRKRRKTNWSKVFIPRGYLPVARVFSLVVWDERRPERKVSKFRRRVRLALSYGIYGGALISLAAVGWVLVPPPSEPLPVDLIGVWETRAPAYADRTFEIAEDALVFKTGERVSDYDVYPITKVRTAALSEQVRLFRVSYGDEETGGELGFQYQAEPQPRIRFENQKDLIWRRRR